MNGSQTPFDRALSVTEMPGVIATKPSTLQAVNALLGHTGTFIIQTAKSADDGFTIFLQVADMGDTLIRLVLPNAVAERIASQRRSLIDRSRRKAKPRLTKAERQAERLREARRIVREAKKNGTH